jgi:hypothetical protein
VESTVSGSAGWGSSATSTVSQCQFVARIQHNGQHQRSVQAIKSVRVCSLRTLAAPGDLVDGLGCGAEPADGRRVPGRLLVALRRPHIQVAIGTLNPVPPAISAQCEPSQELTRHYKSGRAVGAACLQPPQCCSQTTRPCLQHMLARNCFGSTTHSIATGCDSIAQADRRHCVCPANLGSKLHPVAMLAKDTTSC